MTFVPTHTHQALTTYNIKGTESDVVKAVEGPFSCLLLQLFHQDLGLLVHHLQKLCQNGEVEGGGQHLAPPPPLVPCAGMVEGETAV